IFALTGIGLSLTYGILRFANFAHGDVMTLGAFIGLLFLGLGRKLGISSQAFAPLSFGAPMLLALAAAMVVTAL
ncbi:MAG: branched-chain amino acid ABC transporter permease, partial [Gammaproteobacteria bacterium]|nr:branched-chain amino acid ABC transporter permease [Gammaproteobacteria bacterium]